MNFDLLNNYWEKIKYYFSVKYLFSIPEESPLTVFWFCVFLILVIITIAVYFFFRAKGKKEQPYFDYAKTFFWTNFSLGLLGLFNVFSRYEEVAIFSWRFWGFILLALILGFNVWIFIFRYRKLQDELLKFHNKARKEKWLKKKK